MTCVDLSLRLSPHCLASPASSSHYERLATMLREASLCITALAVALKCRLG